MSTEACGMTFEQYVEFHCGFVALMRQVGDGEKTDADIVPFLKGHGQDAVFDADDPEALDMDYYMGAGLKPWEDIINANADLAGKRAMLLMQAQNQGLHRDSTDSAQDVEIEGISLETYAKVSALTHAGGITTTTLYAENGVRDEAHWNAVNTGYLAAMATDTTGRLAIHYGELFMKYQPQHAAAVNQHVADTLGEGIAEVQATEKRDVEVKETVYRMASSGDPAAIAHYVKEMITDADDEDELDWFIEPAADRLAEEKQWDALKVVLAARFLTLEPGGDRDEWIQEEFDSLYEEDDE